MVTTSPQNFTLAALPYGTVVATQTSGSGETLSDSHPSVSVSGLVATVTGGIGGTVCTLTYQTTGGTSSSRARVRKYLGAAGQTADAAMISNLGGVWTSSHVGTGLAYLVVELDYDTDSFPGGIPNVSAVVRGMKCYDPRTATTAWTENPALLMRAYATHALGGRQATTAVDDNYINAAANVCDATLAYVVGTSTFSRATYTAGITTKVGTRPSDVLNDLAQAMGGRWCMVDGTLRVKAGCYTAPVMALDASWLHEGGAVTVTPGRNRMDVINAVTGTYADEASDYRVGAFPRVTAAAYVTTDGADLPTDMQMAAVTFTGQAQYIAACALRYARSALTVKLTCNLRAYQCEPFDVITVTLDRFGWSSKTFEVLDTSWTLDGGIELTLKAIDSTIWALDSSYVAGVPAANTRLPSPWDIPPLTGLAAISDATTVQKQPDGSKKARILATWTTVPDQRVTQNGSVEIRWGRVTDPESSWQSVDCAGSQTATYLDPVHVGASYIVKARTKTVAAVSPWSAHVLCNVSNTTSFGGTVDFSAVTGTTKPANNATVNRVTYSSTAPSSPVDGDMWVDTTAAPYVIKVRVSGAWQTGANLSTGTLAQLNSVDTSQIAAGAATAVSITTAAGPVSVTNQSHIPDGSAYNTLVASITLTPASVLGAVAVDVLVHASAQYSIQGVGATAYLTASLQDGTYDGFNRRDVNAAATGTTVTGSLTLSKRFSETANASVTFALYANILNVSDVASFSNIELRAEVIKR